MKYFILSEEEIKRLLLDMVEKGTKELFKTIKEKALAIANESEVADEIFMDASESMLNEARNCLEDTIENKKIKIMMYQLSSMLRFIAYDVHKVYIKLGKNLDSDRFFKIINSNKDIPKIDWLE